VGIQILVILKVLLLVTLANGAPVLAKDILGDRFAWPIDGGIGFLGRPVFGKSKTIRGIVLSVVVTSAFAPLIGLNWQIGLRVGSMAMAGDLFSSFLKRRMNLPAGSRATGLDQVPESLFPLLACRNALSLTAVDIVAGVMLFFIGEVLLSLLVYRLGLRERPY
jgi:CDP-archaeol synthase